MLREISQKCMVFVLYTACFNAGQVIISHERVISTPLILLLAANMGAAVVTANVLCFRLERMVVGSSVSSRAVATTLAPAVFMVVALSSVRLGHTQLPLLFAIGYFLGVAAGSVILSLIAVGEWG